MPRPERTETNRSGEQYEDGSPEAATLARRKHVFRGAKDDNEIADFRGAKGGNETTDFRGAKGDTCFAQPRGMSSVSTVLARCAKFVGRPRCPAFSVAKVSA
jgi:hypothetical protein